MTDRAIRVLVADDHPFFRDGLRLLLSTAPDTELVGEAADGEEAVALAAELRPDVLLLDVKMPGLTGIEAAARILTRQPEAGIIMVTMIEDDDAVFAAMRAGARGYLLKGADRAEMLLAIRAVSRGEAIFGPAIASRLIRYFGTRHATNQREVPFPELTDRERDVLALIASGHDNAEIAHRLFLSPKTVRNYVSSVLAKLQVSHRGEAIIRAREAGIG